MLSKTNNFLGSHTKIFFLASMILFFMLVVSRRPDIIHNAQFWAEDGYIFFKDAYEIGPINTIFKTSAGYFIVLIRIFAGLSLLFPIYYVPLFFNVLSICFFLLPVGIILSPRFRNIIKSKYLAFTIGFLYVGILNTEEIFGNLANIIWPLALAGFLVLFITPPKNTLQKAFDIAVLSSLGLSSPAGILLIPLACYLWFKNKSAQNKLNITVIAITSMLQVIAITFISHYQRIGSQNDGNFLDLVKIVDGQVFMGGLLGVEFVEFFYQNNLVLYVLFCLGNSLLIYALVKSPIWLKSLIIYSTLLLISMLFSLRPVDGHNIWSLISYSGAGQRYWMIPIIAWISSLIWIMFCSKPKLLKVISALLLLLLVWGFPTSWRIKPYDEINFQYYSRRFEEKRPGETFIMVINPGWELKLKKR